MREFQYLQRAVPGKIAAEGVATHEKTERFVRIFAPEGVKRVIAPGWPVAMEFAIVHHESGLAGDSGLHQRATQFCRGAGLFAMYGLPERDKVNAPDPERLLHVKRRA